MGLILAPLPADKVTAWKSFIDEVKGPRKAEFDSFNKRHRLTKHEAWLCETPGGTFVCAIHEGPGGAELIPSVAQSSDPFDKWFAGKLQEIHGMDVSKPPPGKQPELRLGWNA
ncbi:MAG: hypothetical protein ACHREM_20065 [Polyangiales bacterium]